LNIQKEKEKWLFLSIILNVLLAVSKLLVGFYTNTGVIIADGIHSVSDVVNSVLIYGSIKLSGKKSDKFPFGMHKVEDLAALFGGIAIMYVGYKIADNMIFKSKNTLIENIYLVLGFLFLVLLSQILFAFLEFKSSKRLNSPGVKIDLMDWIADIGATIIAITGIVLSYNNIPYAQKIAVFFIVLMIFHGGYKILKDAVLTLLDASVDVKIIKKAESIVKSFDEIEFVDTLFIRKAGSILIADIVLKIKEKSVDKAHNIVEQLESKLKENIENLTIITIHYEPSQNFSKKRALLLDKDKKQAEKIKDVVFVRIEEIDKMGNILSSNEYQNPYKDKGHFMKLIGWFIKIGVEEIVFDRMNIEKDKLELVENLGIKFVQYS
jgi:cation diffusion facilitator family transporter